MNSFYTLFLIYMMVGLCSGFIAGLFGVGGGLVIVPTLIWLFHLQGFDASYSTHLALGTSLSVIMVTSISAIKAQQKRNAIRWDMIKHLAPGLMIGAIIGAWIAKMLSAAWLQLIIGTFALYVAADMYLKTLKQGTHHLKQEQNAHAPKPIFVQIMGVLIGTASAIFGIGGGTLMVPFLTRTGLSIVQSVATASTGGLFIAIAGAFGFIVFGHAALTMPKYSLGFVYLPAFIGIALASVFSAQQGVKLAHYLPAIVLKRLFASLLLLVGTSFLIKASRAFGLF